MTAWAERLETLGAVHRFDYPYMKAGRKRPDRREKLIVAHLEELASARADRAPVVLIGKSMGSRIGCHVANSAAVDGLVCMGYPLVALRGGAVRDEVLLALGTPILFCQGTRDRLCPLDALASVRPRMTAPNTLHIVDNGDHSLRLTKTYQKTTGTTQEDADQATLEAIDRFVAGLS